MLVIVSLICSCLGAARYPSSREAGVEALALCALYVRDAFVLNRIVPYMISLADDRAANVRSSVARGLGSILPLVRDLPRAEVNVFAEMIIPVLEDLSTDPKVLVRASLASQLAQISHAGLALTELSQKYRIPMGGPAGLTFDAHTSALASSIKSLAMSLLTDPEHVVRRTLLSELASLAVFFNRASGSSSFLLSHMITYLNDREWELRADFFEHVVGVAASARMGTGAVEQFLVPLIHIGLKDEEEFVVHRTCMCLASLTSLSLLSHATLASLSKRVVPLLGHPNLWVRFASVHVLNAIGASFSHVDAHTVLLPCVRPFLVRDVTGVSSDELLASARVPLSRHMYTTLVSSLVAVAHILRPLARCLEENTRPALRPSNPTWYVSESIAWAEACLAAASADGKSGGPPHAGALLDPSAVPEGDARELHGLVGGVLASLSPPPADLPLIWAMLPHLIEVALTTAGSSNYSSDPSSLEAPTSSSTSSSSSGMGSVALSKFAQVRSVSVSTESGPAGGQRSRRRSSHTTDNDGASGGDGPSSSGNSNESARDSDGGAGGDLSFKSWVPAGVLVSHTAEHTGCVNGLDVASDSSFLVSCSDDGSVKVWDADALDGHLVGASSATYLSSARTPGSGVRAITVLEGGHSFVAGYSDGGLDVVDVEYTHAEPGRMYSPLSSPPVRSLECGESPVIGLSEASSLIVSGSHSGCVLGWDLRAKDPVWRLEVRPQYGMLTAMAVDTSQHWMVTGSGLGVLQLWDLRFPLGIQSIALPERDPVWSLSPHPSPWQNSWVVVGSGRSNMVSVWDMEDGSCKQGAHVVHHKPSPRALSASPKGKFLDGPKRTVDAAVAAANRTNVLGVEQNGIVGRVDAVLAESLGYHSPVHALHSPRGAPYVLAGGGDRCIRLWDLGSLGRSYLVSDALSSSFAAAKYIVHSPPKSPISHVYEVREHASHDGAGTTSSPPSSSSGSSSGSLSGKTNPARASHTGGSHRNGISCLTTIELPHRMVVSADQGGVLKVWK